ncbi:hypothetical protein L2E82_12724 [Cichorium intybus]|uniref:Uncharacterized protein n=1 Tax=Cichorium intybus TaxID=13427 RepID=A0ACB9GHX7_CICIN|nr:hypothetical protein L2E82_12724 [Cichorium intybus]
MCEYSLHSTTNISLTLHPSPTSVFCFSKKDFHGAFDFEGREQFFQNSQDKLKDLPNRLCTVMQLRVFFTSFLNNTGDKKSVSQSHFLGPTRNCYLTSWSPGCEAGWASTVNPGQKYDYNETDPKKMPSRPSNSKPCCEGFFCPQEFNRFLCCKAKSNNFDAALLESSQNGVSVDPCLTHENESAMKKEDTKWQKGRDIWWQDVVPKCCTTCDVKWVDAEDPLFLLYTSGRTGNTKLIVVGLLDTVMLLTDFCLME